MPLSENRIRELRAVNPVRIERYRNTMKKKREDRWSLVYKGVSKDIGGLSKRELFLVGLFLYWAEGGKTDRYVTTFTNTDPEMVKFFVRWVTTCFDVQKSNLGVRLHLYKDMNTKDTSKFWSKSLDLPLKQFKKPYIKDSNLTGLTYKNGFGKGTCNVRVGNRNLAEYIQQSLIYMRKNL
jgi:hypothetical protein